MLKKSVFLLLILLMLTILVSEVSEANVDEHGNLELSNDYISIIVNQNDLNRGRFAINVTGGDPGRDDDNNSPLVYGLPNPWTSYTTIRIDDTNYVFGGETNRRAGEDGYYGDLVQEPTIEDDSIITKYEYEGIIVKQILSFTKSSTTGLPDTARIEYEVENTSAHERMLGLRLMIDTLLGENDGSPFRIEDEEIDVDRAYRTQEDVPDFWQTFDSVSNPKVSAQGTLRGPELTTPDRLYLSNWGSLADGVWDFDFEAGREYLRAGEYELDSAMALFWEEEPLSPGETRRFATDYGLAGITLVPGILSLGVTSPSELVMDWPDNKAQIIAYVQNTADIDAEDVIVELNAPDDLEIISGERETDIGDLEAGETTQLMWEVSPQEISQETLDYEINVRAENTDDNQVSRSLDIVGPPDLSLRMVGPYRLREADGLLEKNSFVFHSVITNSGSSTAYGVNSELSLAPGLKIKRGDIKSKYLGNLAPGQSIRVPWELELADLANGNLPYSVSVDSENTRRVSANNQIHVPELDARIHLKPRQDLADLNEGDYVSFDVIAENVVDFYQSELNLEYNSELLKPTHVSRGNIFMDFGERLSWNQPEIDFNSAVIKNISGVLDNRRNLTQGSVARLHFEVLDTGEAEFEFFDSSIYDHRDNNISIEFEKNEFNIGGN